MTQVWLVSISAVIRQRTRQSSHSPCSTRMAWLMSSRDGRKIQPERFSAHWRALQARTLSSSLGRCMKVLMALVAGAQVGAIGVLVADDGGDGAPAEGHD